MPQLSEPGSCLSAGTSCGSLRSMGSPSLVKLPIWLTTCRPVQKTATRGGLKAAHQATRFFEEISTIPEPGRLTDSAVYVLAKKEILAAALLGSFPKQAPMFPTVLAALEDVVFDPSVVLYFRICSWWILVQCWGTLRFSDHRGLRPVDILLDSDGMVAKLTRSKTIGSDRAVTMRLVDYLFPSPTDGFRAVDAKN